jgi:sodium-dependent dicarboxylate transporter 2/3/5
MVNKILFLLCIQAGILEPEEVAQSYFKDIIALFFGSLALAYAVESVNLHRRVALFVLSLVGTSTKWYFSFILLRISSCF